MGGSVNCNPDQFGFHNDFLSGTQHSSYFRARGYSWMVDSKSRGEKIKEKTIAWILSRPEDHHLRLNGNNLRKYGWLELGTPSGRPSFCQKKATNEDASLLGRFLSPCLHPPWKK